MSANLMARRAAREQRGANVLTAQQRATLSPEFVASMDAAAASAAGLRAVRATVVAQRNAHRAQVLRVILIVVGVISLIVLWPIGLTVAAIWLIRRFGPSALAMLRRAWQRRADRARTSRRAERGLLTSPPVESDRQNLGLKRLLK
jgi:hypothetical protein